MATADSVENADESSDDITTRQRLEVKQLQSEIQVMKKQVSQGNKKQKKQTQTDISILEREMLERHRREMGQLGAAVAVEPTDTVCRKSRAQKRREDKEARAGRINELIAGMDMAKSEGDVEREELLIVLEPLGLQIVDIAPDGDCMYSSLSHQLKAVRGQTASSQELRRKCAEHIRAHRQHFIQFMSQIAEPFDEYCDKIEHSSEWGGHLELEALSQTLLARIVVYQASGHTQTFGDCFHPPSLLLSYHKHQYHLGEHYNSLTKK